MNPVPAFPSVADAMAAVQAGLRFVAAADATRMSAQAQAECLQMMERANAIVTAARASVLSAFTSGQGYSADADYSPRAWLIHKTRVTKVVAVAHTAWAKRMVTHPRVMAALAAEDLSESYGRTICQWTDKLPEDCRPAADAILLSAAKAGMDLRDLAGLAAEMYQRSRHDLPDEDPAQGFEDRSARARRAAAGPGPAVRVGWQPAIRSAAWQKARTWATVAMPSVRSASSAPSPPVMPSYRFSIPQCLQDTRMLRCGMFAPDVPARYSVDSIAPERTGLRGIVNRP
jgi:hypothetical protein